jgi:putative NADH-flavin reductase
VYRRGTGAGRFTGRHRVGGEVALFDAEGGSDISGDDLAHAIVEEIDSPASRRRSCYADPSSPLDPGNPVT